MAADTLLEGADNVVLEDDSPVDTAHIRSKLVSGAGEAWLVLYSSMLIARWLGAAPLSSFVLGRG